MTKIFTFFAVISLILAISTAGAAPAVPPAKVGKVPPVSTLPPASTPAVSKPAVTNGVTKAAANAGVRTCLERIEQTSNFITAKTQSKAVLFLPSADTDRQLTSASFEVQLPSKAVAYATMTAAPTTGGGCDALYETVVYWKASCAEVAAKGFPEGKPTGVVQEYIQVLQGGPGLKIFLMPTGEQGCVSIKKEVVY